MTSERVRRRLEALLDEADAAVALSEWQRVAEKSRAVLALDEGNADAAAFLKMAEANLGAPPSASAPALEAPRTPTIEQPTSFAGGRYAVRRFLGEGGKKRVFLAHDTRLDRDVAFALIKTEGLDEVGRERVTREAQAMGRLGAHPHVVTIFEIGEEPSTGSGQAPGAPYVVTELLEGGDVEGLLASEGGPSTGSGGTTLPLARTLEIAKGVTRGLAFAHQQGVVHRDLKPGNVWLTSEGVAKIGDFGLAVALDRSRLTTHGLMVGTVAYMPPEQALGGEVTPQADLYSLGAMLYELVTGKPPFGGDSPTAIISQHINTPPVAPSWHSQHCPPDLEALILRLLAKVPADRPASALEVLAALEAVDPEAPSVRHSDSSANPLDRLARGVFVGRERELERLRAAFDEAFAGRGSVVMLVGEPGIGKTRTVQELSTYARMRGAKVFWGRAHEASGAPPYWPWVQVARAYRDLTPDDELRRRQYEPYAVDLQRIFPQLRTLFPNLPAPPPVDSEEAQFQLFDALSSFFRAVSVDTPLVLVLDDLHWADRSTLRMLTHLAREVGMSRLLVTGTYRDTDLDRAHPLSQALAELNREDLFTRINLRGLSESETAAYIRDTAQAEPAAELVRRVHAETEGNPFFLSEVVRLMAEEGAFSTGGASEIRIPEGVKEALGRRLDRLSPEANELLSVAAVVGRECTHALLAALTDFDDDTLLALIEEALRARVLEETGAPGEYRFTHALMQDALYGELSTARRVRMHGRVAETLEALHASELDREAAQLARHFGEASVMNRALAEKAVRYAELAAQRAEAVAAWDEAARWYEQALAGLDEEAEPRRAADLWMALSICARISEQRATQWAAFDRATALYRRLGEPRAFNAAIARAVKFFGLVGELVRFRDLMLEALGAMDGETSHDACWILIGLALSDRSAAGDTYADRARAMGESLGLEGDTWPWRLEHRDVQRLLDRGEYERAVDLGRRLHTRIRSLAASAAEPQLRITASLALSGAIIGSFSSGDIDAGQEYAKQLADFAADATGGGQGVWNLALVACLRNDRPRFNELTGDQLWWGNMALFVAEDALSRGQRKEASRLLPTRGQIGPQGEPAWVAGAARLLLAEGKPSEAERTFAEWSRLTEPARLWTESERLRFMANAAQLLPTFADDSLVEASYRLLTAHARFRFGGPYWNEGADVLRGNLALRLGNINAAARHFEEGLEWARRPDVRFGLVEGRCLQGLADVAEARGDHSKAMEYLDRAAAKFAEYGAKLYLDQVLAKKEILRA